MDNLYIQIFREILSMMDQDQNRMQDGIHLLSIIKWLERMADHCTNLAEHVIFMVKGQDIRHEGKLDVR